MQVTALVSNLGYHPSVNMKPIPSAAVVGAEKISNGNRRECEKSLVYYADGVTQTTCLGKHKKKIKP